MFYEYYSVIIDVLYVLAHSLFPHLCFRAIIIAFDA